MMINAITGKPYQGNNQNELLATGYEDPRFMTYKQALQIGRVVSKGQKSCARLIKIVEKEVFNKKTGRKEKKKVPVPFSVFNWTQTEEYAGSDA